MNASAFPHVIDRSYQTVRIVFLLAGAIIVGGAGYWPALSETTRPLVRLLLSAL